MLLGDDLVLHCVAEMSEPGDGESLHYHWELNGFATALIQQKVHYMYKILSSMLYETKKTHRRFTHSLCDVQLQNYYNANVIVGLINH